MPTLVKCILPPPPPSGGLGCCPFKGGGSAVVDPLFDVRPIGFGGCVLDFVLLCITLCPYLFCNHLEDEERGEREILFQLSKTKIGICFTHLESISKNSS